MKMQIRAWELIALKQEDLWIRIAQLSVSSEESFETVFEDSWKTIFIVEDASQSFRTEFGRKRTQLELYSSYQRLFYHLTDLA
jgi:hypothetical protein